jgi:hypothetical protein
VESEVDLCSVEVAAWQVVVIETVSMRVILMETDLVSG